MRLLTDGIDCPTYFIIASPCEYCRASREKERRQHSRTKRLRQEVGHGIARDVIEVVAAVVALRLDLQHHPGRIPCLAGHALGLLHGDQLVLRPVLDVERALDSLEPAFEIDDLEIFLRGLERRLSRAVAKALSDQGMH